jgi:hypothetical protein
MERILDRQQAALDAQQQAYDALNACQSGE